MKKRTLLSRIIRKCIPPAIIQPIDEFCTRNEAETQVTKFRRKYGKAGCSEVKNAKFQDFTFTFPNFRNFSCQLGDVFCKKDFDFSAKDPNNVVIYDCGGNVGTITVYLKHKFPQAKIKCFEADPFFIPYIQQNIVANVPVERQADVEVLHKAVWINNQGLTFYPNGVGGSIFGNETSKTCPEDKFKPVSVQTARLRDYLMKEEKVDFLKMDIEGAETSVLLDCDEQLKKVHYLFFEYHLMEKSDLGQILHMLERLNFRYYIHEEGNPVPPIFQNWNPQSRMDAGFIIHAIQFK